jgi:hypothetical protein
MDTLSRSRTGADRARRSTRLFIQPQPPMNATTRSAARRATPLLILAFAAATGCATAANQARAAAADPEQRDWIQLFNGRDLDGWVVKFTGYELDHNLHHTFRVEDGLLQVRYDRWSGFNGEFGHLFYDRPFSYYVVAAEYRFVGEQVQGAGPQYAWARRNNGIMVHSQSASSMGLHQDFPISIEVQLLGGLGEGPRSTGNLCTPGTHVVFDGELFTPHCRGSGSATFDGDQWVRVEAMVLGDSVVKHIVNGDTVMTYTRPQIGGGSVSNYDPAVFREGRLLSEGYIALQAETAPIDFRRVELLDLVGCMDPASPRYRNYFVRPDPAACR